MFGKVVNDGFDVINVVAVGLLLEVSFLMLVLIIVSIGSFADNKIFCVESIVLAVEIIINDIYLCLIL